MTRRQTPGTGTAERSLMPDVVPTCYTALEMIGLRSAGQIDDLK